MSSCARCRSAGTVDDLLAGKLPPGERITVLLADGRRVVGVFESVARDTLFCRYRTFPVDSVEAIEICEISLVDTVMGVLPIVLGLGVAIGVVWWLYMYGPLVESAT
jgi:hypothetical protein